MSMLPKTLSILPVIVSLVACDAEPAPSSAAPPLASEPSPVAVVGEDPASPPPWSEELIHAALRKKNPGYDGKGMFRIEDSRPRAAVLAGTGVSDLSPLRGMPLEILDLQGLPVDDLTPLRGMPLVELYLEKTRVEDLTPLSGLRLAKLYLSHSPVKDLDPLRGMPLVELNLFGTRVSDLGPLHGMPLRMLWLNETPVSEISPLSECPLESLTLHRTQVKDLTPLEGSTLARLHVAETPVTDLTPLDGLFLTRLIFTPARISKGLEIVKRMGSIREIGPSFEARMDPASFWKLHADGEFE